MDAALISVRVAHVAAAAVTAGALAFLVLVVAPARAESFAPRCLGIVGVALAATVASGVAWALLEVAAMSGLPLGEAIREGMVPVVLTQTQFGIVADLRLALALVLAAALVQARAHESARRGALACAAALLGSLALTGHAAGTIGAKGVVHVIADALHILAAGAWIGGLLPFALLLAHLRRTPDDRWPTTAYAATRRFSALALASVAVLTASGLVNAWILVGSLQGLIATDYGRLLLAKIALFATMLCLAAVNRLHLTPRLTRPPVHAQADAARRLIRNSAAEIGLGLIVFIIVGVLGAIHPAIHRVAP